MCRVIKVKLKKLKSIFRFWFLNEIYKYLFRIVTKLNRNKSQSCDWIIAIHRDSSRFVVIRCDSTWIFLIYLIFYRKQWIVMNRDESRWIATIESRRRHSSRFTFSSVFVVNFQFVMIFKKFVISFWYFKITLWDLKSTMFKIIPTLY